MRDSCHSTALFHTLHLKSGEQHRHPNQLSLFSFCRNAFGSASVGLCALCGHTGPGQWADEDTSNGMAGMGAVSL